MALNDLTIGELKEAIAMLNCATAASPVKRGEKVFIRTLTYHLVGEVQEVRGDFVRLLYPSWVADSGRWNEALRDGKLSEVEKCLEYCWVNLGAAVDIHPWLHDLPNETI